MSKSQDDCLDCRIKKHREKERARSLAKYYRYREKILEKRRAKSKHWHWDRTTEGRKNRWTLEFIKTKYGYMWRAWFRNPETERLVKFESARYFSKIEEAKEDYEKATR